jgi:integrase
MLANGVNIGVLSKTLGHASIKFTIDSYADILDKMVIQDINMVRNKLKKSSS